MWSGGPATPGNMSADNSTQPAQKLAPARGVFPAGCKWRAVRDAGEKGRALWAVERYQYFGEATGAWTKQQPAACFVRGQPKTHECVSIHCCQWKTVQLGAILSESCVASTAAYCTSAQ